MDLRSMRAGATRATSDAPGAVAVSHRSLPCRAQRRRSHQAPRVLQRQVHAASADASGAELEHMILTRPQNSHTSSGASSLVLPPGRQPGSSDARQPRGSEPPSIVVARSGADVDAAAAAAGKRPFRVGWAGSGIYFWWQLGAMQHLASRFDLTRVPMAGASGGALCAVLARCGVDPEVVTESAYQLSLDHNIWERPLGLVGVWGRIIEAWLGQLLPEDAAERCSGGLGVVVTRLPSCRQELIEEYESKEDLINCCMASAHVPLLLDLKISRRLRGAKCVDGSFPDFFTNENSPYLLRGGALVFDYFHDPNIVRNGRMDMLQLKEYSELKKIVGLGAHYAQRLEEEGAFEPYDLEPVLKKA